MRFHSRRPQARRVPLAEAMEPRVLFATFTVTNVNDSGTGSLRQAILNANATSGDDDIEFNIGGGGYRIIRPASALPAITDPVTLDATTQPGYVDSPLIEVRGDLAGTGAAGLRVNSSDPFLASSVSGLAVTLFSGPGMQIGGTANSVSNCTIGTNPAGASGLGNGGAGVSISGSGNLLAQNVVAYNAGAGVAVTAGVGNDVAVNAFYSNGGSGGLGIDLYPAGPTPNDPLDADTGPNGLQNYPVLKSAALSSDGGATVSGTINSTPNTELSLDFYASPTNPGQGRLYLDQTKVTTDAAGNASFSMTLDGVPAGQFVTATATADVDMGQTTGGNTSEFSAPLGVGTAPPAWLTVPTGGLWSLTGPAGGQTLTLSGGLFTITADPSTAPTGSAPNLTVVVESPADLTINADAHLAALIIRGPAITPPPWLSVPAGGVWSLTGPAGAQTLTLSSGSFAIIADPSTAPVGAAPNLTVVVLASADLAINVDAHLAGLTVGGTSGGAAGNASEGPASGPIIDAGTQPPDTASSTPVTAPHQSPVVLHATSAVYARGGTYAGRPLGGPALGVKKGPGRYGRETLLSFDLSRVGRIRSAKLRLFGRLTDGASAPVGVAVYAAASPLQVNGPLKWNGLAATAGPALATTAVTGKKARWYEWDLTRYLRKQKAAGRKVVTLALKGEWATSSAALFDSNEGANRPQLAAT